MKTDYSLIINRKKKKHITTQNKVTELIYVLFKGTECSLRGDESVRLVLVPSEKGYTLKEISCSQRGSRFLSYRGDPFSEGAWIALKQRGSQNLISLKKWQNKSTKCIQSP